MNNCQAVIERACRRIGVLASGENLPDTELDDAHETLRALYRRLITDGAFGTIADVTATTPNVIAQPNTRITLGAGAENANISFPEAAPDGSLIIVCDEPYATTTEYLFDGQTKTWLNIGDLEPTSPAPLSHRDLIGLSCILAVELAPEYGQAAVLDDMTKLAASRFHSGLIHNWSIEPQTRCDWKVYF